jgi:hypothetical protein
VNALFLSEMVRMKKSLYTHTTRGECVSGRGVGLHGLLLGCCLFSFLCLPAFADQAAWVTKKQADAALAVLSGQKEVRMLCEPCGETVAKPEAVNSAALNKVDGENWEVLLNGEGIDLAYVFVRIKGTWVNLARVLDIPVVDVSLMLPENLVPAFSDEEHAKLLLSSPIFKAADDRLRKAWLAVQPMVPKEDKETLLGDQNAWLSDRTYVLQQMTLRHKHHMDVPEGVLRDGVVDREKAVSFFSEVRAALLEQYAKSLGGGRVEFSGIWAAEESDSQARGLLLDDGMTFIYLCGSGELEEPPAQIRQLATGDHVRIDGRLAFLDRLRCAADLKVEKLAPLPKKDAEPGGESAVQLTVVGILDGGEGDENPYVTLADGDYYTFDMGADGAKDCAENAELGSLIEVSGTLVTPARGFPSFDPKAPTRCKRLVP